MAGGFGLWELPVGFIRTAEGRIEKTPDRQVQQAITSVFRKFRQHSTGEACGRVRSVDNRPEGLVMPAGQQKVKAVHEGRRLPQIAPGQGQLSLE